MKPTSGKKLSLHRETMRTLAHSELAQVGGGAASVQQNGTKFCPTCHCSSPCPHTYADQPGCDTYQCTATCIVATDGGYGHTHCLVECFVNTITENGTICITKVHTHPCQIFGDPN